jgi:hypothetical protein
MVSHPTVVDGYAEWTYAGDGQCQRARCSDADRFFIYTG